MYITVNSIKRNLGFGGIEIGDILLGFPILFIFIVLFTFTPFKQESLVFLMVGIFLLLPISVSKKNRMYKVLILLFTYLIRNKTYVYSKEIKDKGKVMNFGIKERY